MAVLGLRFCARAFSSYSKWGSLFIAVRRPLTIAASLVAEHRLQTRRLSNCGSRAQLLRGMGDLPRPGLEPVSPALAGRFSTTAPPGKPEILFFIPKLFSAPPSTSFLVGVEVEAGVGERHLYKGTHVFLYLYVSYKDFFFFYKIHSFFKKYIYFWLRCVFIATRGLSL